jgi:hypothetical protein
MKTKQCYRNNSNLTKDSFWMVNKLLVKGLGVKCEAILFLAELMEYHNYLLGRGLIKEGGYFYYRQLSLNAKGVKDNSIRSIESETGITKHSQNQYLDFFKKNGFIDVKKEGNPCQNSYKINFEKIEEFQSNYVAKNRFSLIHSDKNSDEKGYTNTVD